MAISRTLQTFIFSILVCKFLGVCEFPTHMRGLWLSSDKNELTFADSTFSGYKVSIFATNNFTCIENNGTKYVVRSEKFKRFGLSFYAYLCLDLQEQTTVATGDLYTYYRASEKNVDANNERVIFKLATFPTPPMSEVCTVTDYTNVRYSILMKNGTIENEKTECPIPFWGTFKYTYSTGSGNLCNDSQVDVCADKTTMAWNYTQCAQIQAYSAGGVTNCVHSTSVNDTYTIHAYNLDATTDQNITYRFTCYQAKGYKTVYATQYHGDCPSTMNETYVPSPGATLVLNASVVCAFPETTLPTKPTTEPSPKTKASTLSAGAIAAIIIICVLIVVALIVLVIFYFYNKRQKQKQAEWEAANRKIDPDQLSPNMRLGLPDETRYDLDRLMYSPDNVKNNLIKRSPRKDMIGIEGLEGYHEGVVYMDENQRQTALEENRFIEKRKRRDNKDEFKAAEKTHKVFSDRITELSKGRKKKSRPVKLAKLRFRPKAKPTSNTPGGSEGGMASQTKDIVIQVEEANNKTPLDSKRKTRFADEEGKESTENNNADAAQKAKKLEDVETLSDIADIENAVDDLSDEETKEPRLILPNLKEGKKDKRKDTTNDKRWGVRLNTKTKRVVVSRYVPYEKSPFIRKITLFLPVSGVQKKKLKWHKPPKLRPRSRPWSAMIRRLRMARANTVSPMPSIPPLRHRLHATERSVLSQTEPSITRDASQYEVYAA